MRQRIVGIAAVAGLVAGVVGIGLVAVATGGGGRPEPLSLAVGAGGVAGERAADAATGLSLPFGGFEWKVKGSLPELDDEARAWKLGREGSAERVARLARALGLGGEVKAEERAWVVTDGDRQLRVEQVPGLPWYLGVAPRECMDSPLGGARDLPASSDPATGIARSCVEVEELRPAEPVEPVPPSGGGGSTGSAGSGVVAEPVPPPASVAPCPAPAREGSAGIAIDCAVPPPERPAGLPTRDGAERIGREVLAKAGLALDGATVRVDDGFSTWYVNADPAVDGVPTAGWAWSVGVGPEGRIEHANGWLGTPEAGDRYPLAGVAKGLERLKGFFGGPVPLGAEPAMQSPMIAPDCPPGVECPRPEPVVRAVTGVRLGLLFSPVYGDRAEVEALLVPAYLFEVEGDVHPVPVVAVADEFLPEPPVVEEPEPRPRPEPAPHPSGEQCAGAAGSSAGGGGSANEPMTVEVCGPSQVKVGEEAAFRVTAYDPDAAVLTDECGGPRAEWGDGTPVMVCGPACAAPPEGASQPAKEPGKHAAELRHAYAEPGNYTVRFTAQSGSQCPHPWASAGEVSLQVTVVE